MNGKELNDRIKNINYDLDKIDYVIYHNNCPDGFGSAWIVWRHLKGDATYLGIQPDKLPNYTLLKNKYVIIVDVSVSEKYLNDVKSVASNVLVIDHHQTYADELENHPNAIIDKEHSAIYITWRVFNQDQKIPQFIRYIEDNDLAVYQINKTEPFMASIGTKLPYHNIDFFKYWDKLLNPSFVNNMIEDGTKYQEYKNYLLKKNMHISIPMKLGGYKVLVLNFGTVGLASDLGNKIAETNPKMDFVLLWSYHYGNKEYSIMLRTRHDNIDLTEIAKLYGGGGHPRAARFSWKGPIEELWDDFNMKVNKKTQKKTYRKTYRKTYKKSQKRTYRKTYKKTRK